MTPSGEVNCVSPVAVFAALVLAKPLNNAQIVRGVFVYTHLNMANLIPFTKRFESSENLIDLLESRGLQICDRNALRF